MLVSINEIKKYVDLKDITVEQIADKLTSAGIEVEGIDKLASATNIVIGEIIECEKHPESDHLHLCSVDIGSEILHIVCGAPNARKGLKVIVARDGAQLPGKVIKKSKLLGYDSDGMLCALNELGVDPKNLRPEQIEGIEELSNDAPIGETDVLKYLGLDDAILDLSLLANRSDAYALYNVAKEIGALFGREVKIPSYNSKDLVDIKYEVGSDTDNCKQFSVRIFKDIKISESPKWLQNVLRNEGIRSINNIVDIGNYAMLLTGQPINMYDYDKLTKQELIVKDNFDCEFIAMDDKKYSLKPGDIVVSSNNEPVCIAGIMTSKSCEVTQNTTNIVVEVANFYGAQIRKTCSRLGLSSDSSQRFIKGINPNQINDVFELISYLVKEIVGCKCESKTTEYNVLNYKQKEIECTFDYINKRLGTTYSNETIINTLNRFYISTKNVKNDSFTAVIPSFRIDIEEKADLSEEVLRFNGVDEIPTLLPLMETTVGGRSSLAKKEKVIANYLLKQGLNRIVTYTLLNKKDKEMLNLINLNENYEILNPITEDRKYIRTNLLASILRCAQYNYNHQNSDFGLFEIAQINDKKGLSNHLSICLVGNKYIQDKMGGNPYTFFDIKGYFETILNMFNIQPTRVRYERLDKSTELHPNKSCKVTLDGKLLAVFGDIYPTLKEEFDFKKNNNIILLELDLDVLFASRTSNIHFIELSKFPSVSRDFAFVINKTVNYHDIKNEIKKLSSLITSIQIFDIYQGEHLEEGKISMALSISFEAKDHTLKEEEITAVDLKIKDLLASKFNAIIRK